MKTPKTYLAPFVQEAKEYFAKSYAEETGVRVAARNQRKLQNFDDLAKVYELGFYGALKLTTLSKAVFLQNMLSTENRVIMFKKIKERECKD